MSCSKNRRSRCCRGTTALFTSLTAAGGDLETTETMISSLMDTSVLSALEEAQRRRHRWIYVLKSRGTAHASDMRQFQISDHGVRILPAQASEGA
jgi:circadian clock protein KaiC